MKKLKLSQERLWSLQLKSNKAYVGDYKGRLFIVDLISKKLVKKIDFGKQFYSKDKRIKEGLGPSTWVLETIKNKIIVANRWGGIFVLKNNKIIKKFQTKESFTRGQKIKNNKMLFGTRTGKIFTFNLKNGKLELMFKFKKSYQKENAIYGIHKFKNHYWVCFADGDLIKIKL